MVGVSSVGTLGWFDCLMLSARAVVDLARFAADFRGVMVGGFSGFWCGC